MSKPLVSRSPDLNRLQVEGYDIAVEANNLIVRVPYVDANRKVQWGFLVSELTVVMDVAAGGERTGPMSSHVVNFVGVTAEDLPCDSNGQVLHALIYQIGTTHLGGGLIASCGFSHKPEPIYQDYYEKMTTYADMLLSEVHEIDPAVKVQTFPPIKAGEDETPLRYFDSASSRAGIGAVIDRLRGQKVIIVGLGGTGSYILDAVAKTPVAEVHLYDGDTYLTHNAFRSPGAATFDQLTAQPLKVHHHQVTYDAMHRGVIAHAERVTNANIDELRDASFVFLAMDTSPQKLYIIEKLQEFAIPMVDCGMGIYQAGTSIAGIVRTTMSSARQDNQTWINDNISFADEDDDEYSQNIQIAELNMLNAAFAVIAWKKYFGYYADFESETSSVYTIDGNHLLNEVVTVED
ncbi:ThiF family adenylyltransferase [Agreia sp. PsM10]|uniref:ThiF family adenylyltransferase n=1 Tax=Agreia sp. PsM10 TaxID=3030533 RepID=UPI00263AE081|nr:ThiF family adenylyltransferase [Agreia sp. PsM10]MDN4640762.1 ThiF family adenylyltransferase [Agreia sp. PsM10]